MSSFSSRPLQIWRSSLAESLSLISGVFAFEVVPSIMVSQTLAFLHEEAKKETSVSSPVISAFLNGMRYYDPNRANSLLYFRKFDSADELLNVNVDLLFDAIRLLETYVDINLTVTRIVYLSDVGIGPSQPLLIIERMPFFRGVGFEIEERTALRSSMSSSALQLSGKTRIAQQYYSTGLALLAAEDQISGLLDAAFMQFYLTIESILEKHKQHQARISGKKLFGGRFSKDIENIVDHVYTARNGFFGHNSRKNHDGQLVDSIAFSIAKQVVVAKWCARELIALELNVDVVKREMRLYFGPGHSVGFDGNSAMLKTDFALPSP